MTDTEFHEPTNKAELLRDLEQGWAEFHTYISNLTSEQLTEPKDAVGWSVKDHVVHIAIWQDGISALLERKGESRLEAMGINADLWAKGFDTINAVLQERFRDLPVDDALAKAQGAYERMHRLVVDLSEEALFSPYRHYDPASDKTEPIALWIESDGYGHYVEHLPWIRAIVAKGGS